jgi:hypothetical protein
MTQDFMVRLQQAIKALPVPAPDEQLLLRVLESRAQGHRVTLPASSQSPRKFPILMMAGGAAAAVAILWFVPRRPPAALVPSFWPDQLYAQGTPSATLPPIPPLDGDSIKSGLWVSRSQVFDEDGKLRGSRVDSTMMVRGNYGELTAWVVTRVRSRGGPDTTWFTTDSMHPLATFSPLMYGASLRHTYTGDSLVRTWKKSESEVERVALPLPTPRLWARTVVLPMNERFLVFLGTRLNSSWQGSYAGTVIANTHESVTHWLELKVIGEDRITVPAGTFDCWKVVQLMEGRDTELTTWVDKQTGWIVREGLTNGRYERVLVSHIEL